MLQILKFCPLVSCNSYACFSSSSRTDGWTLFQDLDYSELRASAMGGPYFASPVWEGGRSLPLYIISWFNFLISICHIYSARITELDHQIKYFSWTTSQRTTLFLREKKKNQILEKWEHVLTSWNAAEASHILFKEDWGLETNGSWARHVWITTNALLVGALARKALTILHIIHREAKESILFFS